MRAFTPQTIEASWLQSVSSYVGHFATHTSQCPGIKNCTLNKLLLHFLLKLVI